MEKQTKNVVNIALKERSTYNSHKYIKNYWYTPC